MAFTVDFYNNGEDPRKINKSLGTFIATASCSPTGSVSSMKPVLICDYNGNLEGANYCTFGGKNYFIRNIEKETGGKIIIQCEVDVLATYASQIVDLPAIAKRSGTTDDFNVFSKYIEDPRQEFQTYRKVQTISMGNLDDLDILDHFILVTST